MRLTKFHDGVHYDNRQLWHIIQWEAKKYSQIAASVSNVCWEEVGVILTLNNELGVEVYLREQQNKSYLGVFWQTKQLELSKEMWGDWPDKPNDHWIIVTPHCHLRSDRSAQMPSVQLAGLQYQFSWFSKKELCEVDVPMYLQYFKRLGQLGHSWMPTLFSLASSSRRSNW